MMVVLGIILGYKMNDKSDGSLISSINVGDDYPLGRVEEVLRFIDNKYVDQLDTDSLSGIAIHSIIDELDPHSVYIPPEEMITVNEDMSGSFKGVGIETLYLDDTVNVVSVLKGGPAELAGLKPFDQLIVVNDSLVAGQGYKFDQIRNMLRGKQKDTHVNLKVKRKGSPNDIVLKVGLKEIKTNSAQISIMIDDSIGLVKIDQFSEHTYQDFMTAVEHLHDTLGMKHLIIDLRNNPGGVLSQVTKIVNQLFTEKERTIVYTEGRKQDKNYYKTNGKTFFKIGKIAVLINGNSASASEILAGAIQDWDRGIIIGERSYGKGLVQEQYNLSNGGAIRLTVSKYYTPSGRTIQKDYTQYNSIANPDSVNQDLHKTLVLNRDIYSNYGINPDIEINDVSSSYNFTNSILSYSYEFIFRKLKSNPLRPELSITNELVAEFKGFLIQQSELITKESLEEIEDSLISARLSKSFTSIDSGKKAAFEKDKNNDEYILAAIQHFKSKLTLAQLNQPQN
jgi:carboxyl-terminal processing protease